MKRGQKFFIVGILISSIVLVSSSFAQNKTPIDWSNVPNPDSTLQQLNTLLKGETGDAYGERIYNCDIVEFLGFRSECKLLTLISKKLNLTIFDLLRTEFNDNKLTANMWNSLMYELDKMKKDLKIDKCDYHDQGKVRYSGVLQYCDESKRKPILGKIYSNEIGIELRFHMHNRSTNYPNCPKGNRVRHEGVTTQGVFTYNRRSSLCIRKLPGKRVLVGSQCVAGYNLKDINGHRFKIEYYQGEIDTNGICSNKKTETLGREIGTDSEPRTTTLK